MSNSINPTIPPHCMQLHCTRVLPYPCTTENSIATSITNCVTLFTYRYCSDVIELNSPESSDVNWLLCNSLKNNRIMVNYNTQITHSSCIHVVPDSHIYFLLHNDYSISINIACHWVCQWHAPCMNSTHLGNISHCMHDIAHECYPNAIQQIVHNYNVKRYCHQWSSGLVSQIVCNTVYIQLLQRWQRTKQSRVQRRQFIVV